MREPDLQNNPTWLAVVAVAMLGEGGRLLMHRRPPGKAHAGLWEFPGGKVEATETPHEALIREITEELDIALDPALLEPWAFAETKAPDAERPIVLLLYKARGWQGEPRSCEGGECGWFSWAEARHLPMPPLDQRLFAQLAVIMDG